MDNTKKIVYELLKNCEENGITPKYIVQDDTYRMAKSALFSQALPVRTQPVKYRTNGEEIFVISDLHIAAGRNNAGVYPGTENFFSDDSFKRFLEFADRTKKTEKALLIINGDIFDFLRITEYPGKIYKPRLSKWIKQLLKFNPLKKPAEIRKDIIENQFQEWADELEKLGFKKTADELELNISKKEKTYGLRTDDYKTIFKLILIKKGHPDFFESLSKWLETGNKLIIVKGNHDVELYWLQVRNYLRLILGENIVSRIPGSDLQTVLRNIVLPNITFIDDSVEFDNDFYVEHGHRYDKFCMILDKPFVEKAKDQINIPFGSFFNRYLLNRVELFYPFLDNVRPSGNVLPMILKENFPLGIKILFQHIPFMIRILFTNFRYIKFMFNKVFWFMMALLIPAGLIIYFNFNSVTEISTDISKTNDTSWISSLFIDQSKNIALLFLSYALTRLIAWFQLTEPSSLEKFARQRFNTTNYKIMTMGHTHNPGGYLFNNEKRFYNTGTWIPVIETSTAEVREDKTFTFLHLERDENGKLIPANNGILQRWNDNAERFDHQVLIKRK